MSFRRFIAVGAVAAAVSMAGAALAQTSAQKAMIDQAKAAGVAMLASRTNLLLSLPMLTSMAMYQTLFG
jgi:uncharacterized membrane protein